MLYSSTVLNKFRIGDLVECIFPEETKVGWIVGLGLHVSNEVLFIVRFADNPETNVSCHPTELRNVSDYVVGAF